MMRTVVIDRPGPPDVLTLRDRPVPQPGPGEIRARVHAFGINRADLLQRAGHYPAPSGVPPDVPGLEYAGVVDAAAQDVASPLPGSRVMGLVGGGAYAEYVVTDARQAMTIPASLSFVEGAAVPEAFLTGFDALERARVTEGEWTLVLAAGSGVGTATIQLVAARGARAIGTSRSPAKLDALRALGAEAVVNTSSEDLAAAVRRCTGDGAAAAIDLVGGALFPAALAALAPRGRLVLVGLVAGRTAEVDLGLILSRRLRIEGTVLRPRSADEKATLVTAFRERVLPLLARGEVRPVVDRVYEMTDVAAAHAYVASNASFGKVVVEVP
ncbi:MAG TPA: NAD(P)H-quinone oxidoreductase [Gemmatimonadales bacterium]|nr:NAD(P)H-quinone oxidoreductase [Gemmatimonadales bacterium]